MKYKGWTRVAEEGKTDVIKAPNGKIVGELSPTGDNEEYFRFLGNNDGCWTYKSLKAITRLMELPY